MMSTCMTTTSRWTPMTSARIESGKTTPPTTIPTKLNCPPLCAQRKIIFIGMVNICVYYVRKEYSGNSWSKQASKWTNENGREDNEKKFFFVCVTFQFLMVFTKCIFRIPVIIVFFSSRNTPSALSHHSIFSQSLSSTVLLAYSSYYASSSSFFFWRITVSPPSLKSFFLCPRPINNKGRNHQTTVSTFV